MGVSKSLKFELPVIVVLVIVVFVSYWFFWPRAVGPQNWSVLGVSPGMTLGQATDVLVNAGRIDPTQVFISDQSQPIFAPQYKTRVATFAPIVENGINYQLEFGLDEHNIVHMIDLVLNCAPDDICPKTSDVIGKFSYLRPSSSPYYPKDWTEDDGQNDFGGLWSTGPKSDACTEYYYPGVLTSNSLSAIQKSFAQCGTLLAIYFNSNNYDSPNFGRGQISIYDFSDYFSTAVGMALLERQISDFQATRESFTIDDVKSAGLLAFLVGLVCMFIGKQLTGESASFTGYSIDGYIQGTINPGTEGKAETFWGRALGVLFYIIGLILVVPSMFIVALSFF